jgi:exopolyphosphatase/guanosine-5'-triphosphate,3'-diphosphate pyrophosphatase
VDCGTNSIRLLVAEVGETLVPLDRRMTIVRLGEGVDRTGMLSEAALERTFTACRAYREVIDGFGAQRVRFVATSASRDARNAEVFTRGVADILGVQPEVVSGQREAELSFTGAISGSGITTPALVVDIGGGSTEFIHGSLRPDAAISVDMGCVRFTERFAAADPVAPEQVAAIRAEAGRMLDAVESAVPLHDGAVLLGLAGTVTTVTALALGLTDYDSDRIHLATVPRAEVARVVGELVSLTREQRTALPVMHPGRADVIVAGALILDEIMLRTGAGSLTASEHDILDGIAWSLR